MKDKKFWIRLSYYFLQYFTVSFMAVSLAVITTAVILYVLVYTDEGRNGLIELLHQKQTTIDQSVSNRQSSNQPCRRENFPQLIVHGTIAFLRDGELWLLENCKDRQLTTTEGVITEFEWDKTGESIFYIKMINLGDLDNANGAIVRYWIADDKEEIMVPGVDLAETYNSVDTPYTFDRYHVNLISISHQGDQLAYTRDGLWVLDINTKLTRRVDKRHENKSTRGFLNLVKPVMANFEGWSSGHFAQFDLLGTDSDIMWSTDDNIITFGSTVVQIDKQQVRSLKILNSGPLYNPQIGFVSATEILMRSEERERPRNFYLYDVVTSQKTKVVFEFDETNEDYPDRPVNFIFHDQKLLLATTNGLAISYHEITPSATKTLYYSPRDYENFGLWLDYDPLQNRSLIRDIKNPNIFYYDFDGLTAYLLLKNAYDARWAP